METVPPQKMGLSPSPHKYTDYNNICVFLTSIRPTPFHPSSRTRSAHLPVADSPVHLFHHPVMWTNGLCGVLNREEGQVSEYQICSQVEITHSHNIFSFDAIRSLLTLSEISTFKNLVYFAHFQNAEYSCWYSGWLENKQLSHNFYWITRSSNLKAVE